jgi:predicted dehydrogenase
MKEIGVALVGCGGITLQNHLPGLALCPQAKVVALCDANRAVVEKAGQQTGVKTISTDYKEIVTRDDVHAVIIATPNIVHAAIALEAIRAGKHVFCEKPLAMNYAETVAMRDAADAAGVRHMTAFTYRFVPAMRYMEHLVSQGDLGVPYHFRSCRLQDWGTRGLGWRQVAKLAGTGELGDMLSHRIDYAHFLYGPMKRIVADTRLVHPVRDGQVSDLEDWCAILAEFHNNASGVLESSKIATGRGESAHSQDYVELNGSEASFVFQLEQPLQLQITRRGQSRLQVVPLPKEFLKVPGSPRDPAQGDPLFTFRYDQTFEFIDAISNNRPCSPSFREGARAQAVLDAAVASAREKRWLDLPQD